MKRENKGGKKNHDAKGKIKGMKHSTLSAKAMGDTPGMKMAGKTYKKVGRVCDPGDGLAKWRKR